MPGPVKTPRKELALLAAFAQRCSMTPSVLKDHKVPITTVMTTAMATQRRRVGRWEGTSASTPWRAHTKPTSMTGRYINKMIGVAKAWLPRVTSWLSSKSG